MQLYVKLENENIIGHDWDKEEDINFYKCKFNNPASIFDTNEMVYKYKVVDGKFIELTQSEKDNHVLKKIQKIQKRKAEILKRFKEIDLESIRPMRAFRNSSNVDADGAKIKVLEGEAKTLREELKTL